MRGFAFVLVFLSACCSPELATIKKELKIKDSLLLNEWHEDASETCNRIYRLYQINDSIVNINNGGCGYFAYYLYQRLPKGEYEIISIGRKHICLREKKSQLYIDSQGYHSKLSMDLRFGKFINEYMEISEDFLKNDLKNGIWNNAFKLSDTVKIKEFIDNL